jgi:hypothetical protein
MFHLLKLAAILVSDVVGARAHIDRHVELDGQDFGECVYEVSRRKTSI